MTGPAVRTPVTRAAASMPLPVDRHLIEAGTFGLIQQYTFGLIQQYTFGPIQQYGVGLELIDVDAATEHGAWAARIAGDASGDADSVAELAVLHLLALSRVIRGRASLVTWRTICG